MSHTDFKVGDVIIVTKPQNTNEIPTWNESDYMTNMEYLTEGTHVIHDIGTFIFVYDERIQQCWSLDPRWCQLAYESDLNVTSPYYKVLRKIKNMQHKRKEAGYAF